MNVLDHGVVNLLNFMGGDVSVVMSARVSNGKLESYTNPIEPGKDKRLINYLVKHRHGTPFEHSVFTFYVKAPIFVTREWMRHRIGSFNEISGRYTKFNPEFYIPEVFRVQSESNKQGSYMPTESIINGIDAVDWQFVNRADVYNLTEKTYEVYQSLLARGVAKEMARMILPVNLYTQFYWTVNARSLMNFLSLRCSMDAQYEIRKFADAVFLSFEDKMPMTCAAWQDNNYVAP